MNQLVQKFDPDSTQQFIPLTDEMLAKLDPPPPFVPEETTSIPVPDHFIFRDMPLKWVEDLHDSVLAFCNQARIRHLHHEPWYPGLERLTNFIEVDLRRHYPNENS